MLMQTYLTSKCKSESEDSKSDNESTANNASGNSSCARPPPPRADPWELAFFFALDGKFPGVGTLELSNPSG